ncbi:MAG: sensor histidine kinase KdpD [Gammaproteobacteria bacterium]|nr:MAG: sensor histidine kinase KdpD [Gammaproteobacteria bacterium]
MQRPNPERLLRRVQEEERQEQRGKLKIYLGAAPGVGKTYTMLQDAIAKRAQGLDVVLGVVESHGRQEIEALLGKLEILPRKAIDYHGRQLLEFDLDAALKRNPGLILMDEMAHTNAPGVRHAKRWQDIKELLDRGIDVYTTLNVQHIESRNDLAAQIIHARIKETVPDSMIELAETIELVDLPPEDLLKRLQEGKVYFPAQAELAKDHYFRKGNLAALRELALRVTAERVSAQVLLYRQGQGIKYIWPTKEKILVCVGPGPESLKLIRTGRRLAAELQTEWLAVYVDTPRRHAYRNSAIQNLHLAAQLGAETRVLTGFDIVKEVIKFAHEQNITQIVVWKKIRPRWQSIFFANLADEVVRYSGEIDVYVVTGGLTDAKPLTKKMDSLPFLSAGIDWSVYGVAIGVVALTTVINLLFSEYFKSPDIVMLYLVGITLVALFAQTGPSLLAACLSVLVYDFFFIPPYNSFAITNISYFFTLGVMFIVSLIISYFTIQTRHQAELARSAERQMATLHTLSRRLASTRGVDKLIETGVQYIAVVFDSDVLALLPEGEALVVKASSSGEQITLDAKEQSVAKWVYDLGQVAGLGTETLSFSKSLYVPLLTSKGVMGVLSISPPTERLFTPEQMHLLEACANQIALAIEVEG